MHVSYLESFDQRLATRNIFSYKIGTSIVQSIQHLLNDNSPQLLNKNSLLSILQQSVHFMKTEEGGWKSDA